MGEETPAVADLRARLGRLEVSAGRFDRALAVVGPVIDQKPGAHKAGAPGAGAPPLALEAALLARAYSGDRAGARALLASLGTGDRGIDPARISYLAGLVDQLDGKPSVAVGGYRRAFERSAAIGDVHTLAAVAVNLGALQAEAGAYGEALAATERAIRELGRLGATAELGTALFNAANLFVQVGQLGAARRALARARDEGARRGATPVVEAFATFVEGDLERREGQPARAKDLYRQAASALREQGRVHEASSASLAEAETLAEAGQPIEARRTLAEAAAQRAGQDQSAGVGDGDVDGDIDGDDELAMARGRVLLVAGAADRPDVTAAPPGAFVAPARRPGRGPGSAAGGLARGAACVTSLAARRGSRAGRRSADVRDPHLRGGPHGDTGGTSFGAGE